MNSVCHTVGGHKSGFFVDVINGWPLTTELPFDVVVQLKSDSMAEGISSSEIQHKSDVPFAI